MSQKSETESINMKYYYNKKSKYFESSKDISLVGRVSVEQFLKYLKFAYCSNNPYETEEYDFYLNGRTSLLRITKLELFCELIDIDEMSLYSVMSEREDLSRVQTNTEHELFSYCDYLFDIPSKTNLTVQSDSSCESNTSLDEEHLFETDKQQGDQQAVEDKNNMSIPSTGKGSIAVGNSAPKELCKSVKKQIHKSINSQMPVENSKVESKQDECDSEITDKPGIFINEQGPSSTMTEDCTPCDLVVELNKKIHNTEECCVMFGENNRCPTDNSLVIHVKDNARKMTKDYYCTKELLVSKMGYFVNKNLRNASITIHCDLTIFDCIMDWIIQSDLLNKSNEPFSGIISVTNSHQLNSKNIIGFLSCVSFLQIHELIDLCLCYCKNNVNDILKSNDFSHFSSNLFNRFGNMFTNVEVEALNDKKDKIRSYLYFKLILSLSQLEPEPWRGHFSSLANVFRCGHCNKLVMHNIASKIPCLQNNIRMNLKGEISNVHTKEANWNLTEYIASLRRKLKTWRKVYWRLWAECHFMYCTSCKSYYSVYYYNKCWYHPEKPQFSTGQNASDCFPCCGSRAFIYECISRQERGCKVRNHLPILKNNRASTDVMKLLERFHHLIFANLDKGNESLYSLLIDKVQLNLIGDGAEKSGLVLNENKKQVQWTLPYFIPDQIHKGLLIQEIGRKKRKCRPKFYSNWGAQTDQQHDAVVRTSSSCELWQNMSENKHKRTIVGILMQSENLKSDCGSETSSSDTSDNTTSHSCSDSCEESETDGKENFISNQKQLFLQEITATTIGQRRAVRINQDNQRECEEHGFVMINSILCSKSDRQITFTNFNKTLNNMHCRTLPTRNVNNLVSSNSSSSVSSETDATPKNSSLTINSRICRSQKTAVWNSHVPLAGTYVRIKSEWSYGRKYRPNLCKCTNSQFFNQIKFCRCNNETSGKNFMYTMLTRQSEWANKMCFFDTRSQEQDSAACRPVMLRKEYKLHRYHLNIDWKSVIDVEQKWNAFLQLLNESEVFPNKENKNKYNPKFEIHS